MSSAPRLRTLLVLGRVSNLPTVWSNCLAGWWLGGHGHLGRLPLLFLGVSALYTGSMFLNDAFDAEYDRQRRPGRPIPSGQITAELVWVWGFVWVALGFFCLLLLGTTTGVLAFALLVCMLLFNATHKVITASPWLMGLCRFWVYVIAGSTGIQGVNGWPIWCGLALALYVAGLGCVAQRAGGRGPVPFWPLALLAAPAFLALLMNAAAARVAALWLSLVLILWIAFCVRPIFQRGAVAPGRTVPGLLAGIVIVDWLAVAGGPHGLSSAFLVLFLATLWLQQLLPAV
ncbi:MAG: UbiA family prenyltransferase [Verrucomicrobiota bacterium]|nr:UbiA family prenyltransferase [Verrucomicrobiota bacterium]